MATLETLVSLAKRRGFVYPSSEIYGGLANVYDYGPLGVELLRNIRDLWWKEYVTKRHNIVGLESAIFMHPNVWKASGHVAGFSDPMIDDAENHKRYRADHVIADWCKENNKEVPDTDNMILEMLDEFITSNHIISTDGNAFNHARNFNLMFKTKLGSVENDAEELYLRAETAQGMYVDFKNILDSTRLQVPFGVAQQGRVFRNEITKGKFIFRMLEFQQMEIQYFFNGKEWEKMFEQWRQEQENWYQNILKINKSKLKWKPHAKLIFYAKAAEDLTYQFPWGADEVTGLHYRTDYDLSTHAKHSAKKLEYRDPFTGEVYVPHVLETTWGLDRNFFMLLDNAYFEEEGRVVLKLPFNLAPYKVAVFPLVSNKEELVKKANGVYEQIGKNYMTYWDDRGNIGKRYRYQDEVGTPLCVTIDYQTLTDDTVTVRSRDTMAQERVAITNLTSYIMAHE
ncbi:MAG: glycine--tRNA ligase [Candidatus Roizmanbacteria bacterium]|nr:glycine--tRNA ligase [Candidatus Roizmanbacteria bacterium]